MKGTILIIAIGILIFTFLYLETRILDISLFFGLIASLILSIVKLSFDLENKE